MNISFLIDDDHDDDDDTKRFDRTCLMEDDVREEYLDLFLSLFVKGRKNICFYNKRKVRTHYSLITFTNRPEKGTILFRIPMVKRQKKENEKASSLLLFIFCFSGKIPFPTII